MSYLCKNCGITFADRQSKKWHYTDSWRETSYDTDLNEHRSGHYLGCVRDNDFNRYFERGENKVYHLKKDAILRIKADRGFITRQVLEEILTPFDLSVEEIIKKMPDVSIRGSRYNPQGIEKTKALSIVKAFLLDN